MSQTPAEEPSKQTSVADKASPARPPEAAGATRVRPGVSLEGGAHAKDEDLDERLAETFPASDPPAASPGAD